MILRELREIDQATDDILIYGFDGIDNQKIKTDLAGRIDLTPFPGLAFRGFVTNGGSSNLNVNGSVTPVEFTITPPVGKTWYIHNISLVLEDNAINFTKFGGILALTNGVDFKVKQNGLLEELLTNIKNNGEFYTFANQVLLESSAIDILVIQVNIKTNTGTTFKLINSTSDNFKVVINDDLTAINKFQIVVRGYEVAE